MQPELPDKLNTRSANMSFKKTEWCHIAKDRKWAVLSGLQGDDDEDGASVHPSHTAGVAHEVVQDGCELCSHLHRAQHQRKTSVTGTKPFTQHVCVH